MNNVDTIILGHNQFIGVSHLSQDTAKSRVEHFSDYKNIIDIIKFSSSLGVKSMMISTHPRTKDILEHLKTEGLNKEMTFYPLIPYAQGYVRKANEFGTLGLLNDVLKPASISKKFNILLQGGFGFLRKDFLEILKTVIDVELLPFQDSNVKAIFLHNVFTDLALGLKAREIIEFYIDYVRDNYNTVPAFETMNFARLVETFDEWGIKQPLIMTSFNKAGFQMNPSVKECERCLRDYKTDVVAMSTLAAGYLKPKEAYEYLFSLPNIKSVVVGVSTKEHARETFGIINELMIEQGS